MDVVIVEASSAQGLETALAEKDAAGWMIAGYSTMQTEGGTVYSALLQAASDVE